MIAVGGSSSVRVHDELFAVSSKIDYRSAGAGNGEAQKPSITLGGTDDLGIDRGLLRPARLVGLLRVCDVRHAGYLGGPFTRHACSPPHGLIRRRILARSIGAGHARRRPGVCSQCPRWEVETRSRAWSSSHRHRCRCSSASVASRMICNDWLIEGLDQRKTPGSRERSRASTNRQCGK